MKNFKKNKRLLSSILILIMLFTSMLPVNAAIPNISTRNYIRTYVLSTQNNTSVYTNSNLSQKGTASPYRVYNAKIYATDEVYVFEMNSKSAYISYPTSSGRRYGWINTSALTSNNFSVSTRTSTAKITTYKRAGSLQYGSISKGDKVYTVARSGSYTQVVYPVGSNYKMGWISNSSYNKYINSSSSSSPSATSSAWQYPMNNAYVCGNNWGSYYKNRPSRPYHAGIDIASRNGDSNVYAAATGIVAARGYNSSNGNYVVLKHTIGGKTVYSFYAHLRSIAVNKNAYVSKGSKIGVFGNTGSSSAGSHLHFAIVDKLSSNGGYYGYVSYFSGYKATYSGKTYYSPHYVISNNRLP